MERGSKRVRLSLTVGEQVCLAFMEHLKGTASGVGIEIGSRTNEVVAFGKMGVTCKTFRAYLKDPVVANTFDYEIETMLSELS